MLCCIFSLTAWALFDKQTTYLATGTVTDEQNNPLQDVVVAEVGVNNQTKTDKEGHYSLTIHNAAATIRFVYIGYDMQEIKITGATDNKIILKKASTSLDETIINRRSKMMHRNVMGQPFNGAAPGLYKREMLSDGYAMEMDESLPNSREGYDGIVENPFKKVTDNPLSTFSIDVDGASYSNVRRYIQNGSLPPAGAVRIEEMINYFHYSYPQPTGDDPFSINTEMTECPWNNKHQLMLIGLQGKRIATEKLPASNLVFLVDVSGSMDEPSKLPLVKSSMKMLAEQLRNTDRVAIVVYAGNAGLVLPPTNGDDKKTIFNAIDNLQAGGSTAGGAGIQLAYKTAREYFKKEGNNRVILCTDGDFNVGESSDDAMERLITKERESGVFLSVLGFGMGNYQDAKMQKLANKGNGNHAYIDNLGEAKKVLVTEFGGTLFTIAKDVKLQVEFNPAKVQGYRLIGYENRMLNKEDFNNDKKDAGELGSGHTVTALYEIIPAGIADDLLQQVDDLKYQEPAVVSNGGNEWMTIKFRYKKPADNASKLITQVVGDTQIKQAAQASENIRFAAAIAEFGLLLRQSEFKQNASYNHVLAMANTALENDKEGYKKEFVKLVESAKKLSAKEGKQEDVGVK